MITLTKTIKLRLYTTCEQDILFQQSAEQYRLGCNYVSNYIFEHDFNLDVHVLNKELYHELRDKFGLKSQMAQSVIKTVIARYKTVETQLSSKPYKYKEWNGQWKHVTRTLEWLWKPVFFNRPQIDLVRNRDYSFLTRDSKLSINTLGSRVKCSYASGFFISCLDGSWKLGTAKLVKLKDIWYLHIPVSKKIDSFDVQGVRHVVGIDRGLRFLAVCYDEKGKSSFFSGKKIAAKKHKFLETRRQLQAKGTKSARRKLKAISGRENRWMTNVNHCISKTLVDRYGPHTLFTLEDLTGVSFEESNLSRPKKMKYDLRSWSFYQLEQFLSYKAHECDSEVVKVSAKYTSQRCPKCGMIRKQNRNHQKHLYSCQCGYKSNDDRIGAMNIQLLGTLWVSGIENPKFKK